MNQPASSTVDADIDSAMNEHNPKSHSYIYRSGAIIWKIILVIVGISIGAFLAQIIAVFTGLIRYLC